MFTKSILFILTALFILSCLTGCDVNGKSASQERQEKLIAKLNQEKMDKEVAAAAATDYTYSQKTPFLNEMKKELANIQEQLDQLSETVNKTEGQAKTDLENTIKTVREELEVTKKYIEATEQADESSWETTKNEFRKANNNLRDLLAKTNKAVLAKIGQ